MQKQVQIILEQAKEAALKAESYHGNDTTQWLIWNSRYHALNEALAAIAASWLVEIDLSGEYHLAWQELNEFINDLNAVKA